MAIQRYCVKRTYFLDHDYKICCVDSVVGEELPIWPHNNKPLRKQVHEQTIVEFEYDDDKDKDNVK